jgi:hypothetical protein
VRAQPEPAAVWPLVRLVSLLVEIARPTPAALPETAEDPESEDDGADEAALARHTPRRAGCGDRRARDGVN